MIVAYRDSVRMHKVSSMRLQEITAKFSTLLCHMFYVMRKAKQPSLMAPPAPTPVDRSSGTSSFLCYVFP
jgi:hypothetical protein